MCLPVCPTYAITQQEQSSPRGRIRLIRSVLDGSLAISETFADEMNFCLDCQACQTACPAGVKYGELVEESRQLVADKRLEPFAVRMVKRIFLRGILGSNARTKFFGRVLRLYQKCGLREAVEHSGILKLFPQNLHRRHLLLPHISETFFDDTVAEVVPAMGKQRGRVAFLSGCIMNIAFADVHHDCIDVLTANGYEVIIPKSQPCCGSLHGHNGDLTKAKELARSIINVFGTYTFDALVVDSAGCGAFLKEYERLFENDPDRKEAAAVLSQKTKDINEFLTEVGFSHPVRDMHCTVTYHEACHLVHTQNISKQPRQIISSVPGTEFVELPEATWCCGSAGIYNITRYEDSMKMLDRKIGNLVSTGADIVVTANPGCHLQLQYGIKNAGLACKVMHPVSLVKTAMLQND
jgi:glycolate oxidase iron-sulfur subunit